MPAPAGLLRMIRGEFVGNVVVPRPRGCSSSARAFFRPAPSSPRSRGLLDVGLYRRMRLWSSPRLRGCSTVAAVGSPALASSPCSRRLLARWDLERAELMTVPRPRGCPRAAWTGPEPRSRPRTRGGCSQGKVESRPAVSSSPRLRGCSAGLIAFLRLTASSCRSRGVPIVWLIRFWSGVASPSARGRSVAKAAARELHLVLLTGAECSMAVRSRQEHEVVLPLTRGCSWPNGPPACSPRSPLRLRVYSTIAHDRRSAFSSAPRPQRSLPDNDWWWQPRRVVPRPRGCPVKPLPYDRSITSSPRPRGCPPHSLGCTRMEKSSPRPWGRPHARGGCSFWHFGGEKLVLSSPRLRGCSAPALVARGRHRVVPAPTGVSQLLFAGHERRSVVPAHAGLLGSPRRVRHRRHVVPRPRGCSFSMPLG